MKMRKTITVALPCRNEVDNIEALVGALKEQFQTNLCDYDYYLQFMDNCSTDGTREVLRRLCEEDPHVRAIFNIANFPGSAFHGILQAEGDCCIFMASDFQDPPEILPELVREWEKGAKVVCAIKTSSDERRGLWAIRSLYYQIIGHLASVPQIEHFTGFGLYDRDFIEIVRSLNDPTPTLRGVVAEYGYKVSHVNFHQPKRFGGHTKQHFLSNFDFAMKNITTYVHGVVHFAVYGGILALGVLGLISVLVAALYIVGYREIDYGFAAIMLTILIVASIQASLIGFVGEYVMNANDRLRRKPYAIEEERLGFTRQATPDVAPQYHPSIRKKAE